MSNERRVHSITAQQFFFEGKYYCGTRDNSGELRQTSCSPSPHLWRHIVQHWHACFSRGASRFHVESRIIDEDQQTHAPALDSRSQLREKLEVARQMANHFDETHHCHFIVTGNQIDTSTFHSWTTDAGQSKLRPDSPQLLCYSGCMKIRRRFSGNEEYVSHEP
jgi:hypothetical protein